MSSFIKDINQTLLQFINVIHFSLVDSRLHFSLNVGLSGPLWIVWLTELRWMSAKADYLTPHSLRLTPECPRAPSPSSPLHLLLISKPTALC